MRNITVFHLSKFFDRYFSFRKYFSLRFNEDFISSAPIRIVRFTALINEEEQKFRLNIIEHGLWRICRRAYREHINIYEDLLKTLLGYSLFVFLNFRFIVQIRVLGIQNHHVSQSEMNFSELNCFKYLISEMMRRTIDKRK